MASKLLLGLALILALAVGAFLVADDGSPAERAINAQETAGFDAPGTADELTAPEWPAPAADEGREPERRPAAAPPDPAALAASEPASDERAGPTSAIELHFVDRNRSSVGVEFGRVTLAPAAAAGALGPGPFDGAGLDAGVFEVDGALTVTAQGATSVLFEHLPLGRWIACARVPGFRALPVAVQVDAPSSAEDPVHGDVVLWAERELPVVVRGAGGRSMEALAADFGCAPHELWSGTFDVRLRLGPDAGGVELPEALGRYHAAPGHKRWNYFGDVIGTLVLERDPPLWAELVSMGGVVAQELITPDLERLDFTLDPAAVGERLARLRLTAVDCLTGAPLAGAAVTLKADSSTYRRGDHHDLRTAADGTVLLERIVPGPSYELTVETDAAIHQRWVTFDAGEERDLGSIELGCGGGDPLVVRIVEGPPEWNRAYVEIGPFAPGEPVEDLYPGNLHRGIGRGEDYLLPMPERPTILRAQIPWHDGPRGAGLGLGRAPPATWSGMSDNVLIDPTNRPVGPIELRLRPTVDLDLLIAMDDLAEVRVLDDLGLLLGRIRHRGTTDGRQHWTVEITQGTYTLVLVDTAGAERLRRRTTFDEGGVVELP